MRKEHLFTLALVSAFAAGSLTAGAQDYSREVTLPGITGLVSHDAVPAGFNPVMASASQLEEYGFPMRPDPNNTKAYSMWLQAVSLTRIRGEYIDTGRHHLPIRTKGQSAGKANGSVESGNWSGFAITGGSPIFAQVAGRWTVPSVASQHESFTGYMSTWVGIDGDCDCDDLIQDGTEQAWDGSASYFAWVEFIPEDEVEVNLAVSPGDVILAYSWVSEKSGVVYGNYTLGNENTGQSISTSIKIPPNTKYSGLSAEWIVERTEVNGNYNNPLPDYAYSYMDEAYYWRTGQDGFPYSEEVNQTICMTNLSNCTKPISEASELGSDAMLFTWVQYDN